MTGPDLPAWASWVVLALVLGGASLSLIGALGLVRLPTFYERVHAPTLTSTLGAVLVLAASMVAFSVAEGRPVPRAALIAVFLITTTPVALMLLARAAAYRQRAEGADDAPPEP